MHLGIVDRLVVGVHHRDQAGVGSALDVVLPAKRMQPRAGLADVAGNGAERDQTAAVVGARRVLRHPHAPVNDPGAGLAPESRHLADHVGVDTADLRGALWRVGIDNGLELLEAGCPQGDVVLVDEAAGNDLVQDTVEERNVRSGLHLAVDVGVVGDPLAAWIDDDQGRPAAAGLLEEGRCDWMVGGRVRAGKQRHVRVDDISVRRRHGAGSDALEEGRDARGVAEPGAVVDVVRSQSGADQLLEEVGLLVGALRRAEARERLGAMLVTDRAEPADDEIECLVPARLAKRRHHLVVVDDPTGLASPASLTTHVGRERALRVEYSSRLISGLVRR